MNKLKNALAAAGGWLLARLREPSTWAGLGALLIAYRVPHAQEWNSVLVSLGTAVAGGVAIVLPEKTS